MIMRDIKMGYSDAQLGLLLRSMLKLLISSEEWGQGCHGDDFYLFNVLFSLVVRTLTKKWISVAQFKAAPSRSIWSQSYDPLALRKG